MPPWLIVPWRHHLILFLLTLHLSSWVSAYMNGIFGFSTGVCSELKDGRATSDFFMSQSRSTPLQQEEPVVKQS